MNPSLGFMGLGLMGKPMALNLLMAGYPLTVWNRTAEKMTPLLEAGAKPAKNPADLAKQSEIIFVMITDAPQVREVVLGEQGIIHGAKPGTIIIDTSSIAPSAEREISRKLAAEEIHLLDAPVSGGPEGAAKGTLAIMVGGDEDIFKTALPVLQALGKTIRYVGGPGMGQLVKLCNQVACALNILAMSEAFLLAQRGGADMALVREVLMGGAAGSWMLENWGPKILANDYTPGFTVANFQKDLRNVMQEATDLQISLPGAALAHQLYHANEIAGESQESNVAIFKTLLRLAGQRI